MAEIIGVGDYGNDRKENPLARVWRFFWSLQKSTKVFLVIFLAFAIATPVIVSDYLLTQQNASANGTITFFAENGDSQITQTEKQEIQLQLTPPENWSFSQARKPQQFTNKSFINTVYAQAEEAISPTDTASESPTIIPVTETILPPIAEESPIPPTETPTATDTTTPIPEQHILTKIVVSNTDGGVPNGSEPLTVTGNDILSLLNQRFPWRLNGLTEEEFTGTRVVTVEFTDAQNNTITATGNIVLTKPIIPTSTELPNQITPTETPPETPTITPTVPSQPEESAKNKESVAIPGQVIVKYKKNESPEQLLQTVVKRQVQRQSITGRAQIAVQDTATSLTGGSTPEEKLEENLQINQKVKLQNTDSFEAENASSEKELPLDNVFLLKTDPPIPASELQEDYKQLSNIEYAAGNYMSSGGDDEEPPPAPLTIPPLPTGPVNPNDSYYRVQWNLAQIRAPQGWDITTGSSNTIVAVLDTGVNYNHDDLPGPNKPTPNRIILGPDYITGDNDPDDEHGHGTFIAGQIAAITNNNVGISGIDWQTHILAVRVLNAQNLGDSWTLKQGIESVTNYAKTHPDKKIVINMSLQSQNSPPCATGIPYLHDAITAARAEGITLVTISGNYGEDTSFSYPGNCQGVINVGATKIDLTPAGYSNQGTHLDIWAPVGAGDSPSGNWGCDYLRFPELQYACWTRSLGVGDSAYEVRQGTSFAGPQVAAVASLMLALNPSLTPDKIEEILINSANRNSGYRVLDMNAALLATAAIPVVSPTMPPLPTPTVGPLSGFQNPVQTNLSNPTRISLGGTGVRSMGFRFKPLVDGHISNGWNYIISGTHKIKLYSDTGELLRTTTISANNTSPSWKVKSFSPPEFIKADTYYRLVLETDNSNWYTLALDPDLPLPRILRSIEIDSDLEVVQGSVFPPINTTVTGKNQLHGIIDFTFIPGVGPTVTDVPPTVTEVPPTVTLTPVIGDVDNNYCIDNRDFDKWLIAFNGLPITGDADLNNDGHITILDFNMWYKAVQTGLHPCP